jgi:hypothetical protein
MLDLYFEADHPVTSLNPQQYTRIYQWKAESGRLFVRGENTMWFASSLCQFWTEKEVKEFIKELEER